MNEPDSLEYSFLVCKYQACFNEIVALIEQGDKNSSMNQLLQLMNLAFQILKLSVLTQEQTFLPQATVLLQNTTRFSICLSNIWGLPDVDQSTAWELVAPIMNNLRRDQGYN